MTTIKLTNVDKNFGQGSSYVEVLKDINFEAKAGEMVLILGPSGSGKSTFLTIAGGLQTPSAGTVQINQQSVQQLSAKQRDQLRLKEIGFILQAYNLVPYLTVQEQFQLADKVKKQGNLSPEAFKKLLTQLEIDQLVKKYPNQLSGGQTQRVAIARALYTDPAIILADEPTAALDSDRVQEVGRILSKLAHDRQKTVIVVTHDQRLLDYADRVYQILDGKLTAS